jgi:hypothetical protein
LWWLAGLLIAAGVLASLVSGALWSSAARAERSLRVALAEGDQAAFNQCYAACAADIEELIDLVWMVHEEASPPLCRHAAATLLARGDAVATPLAMTQRPRLSAGRCACALSGRSAMAMRIWHWRIIAVLVRLCQLPASHASGPCIWRLAIAINLIGCGLIHSMLMR